MPFSEPKDPQEVSLLHKELTDLRRALAAKEEEIAELRRCLDEPRLDALTGLAHRKVLEAFLSATLKEEAHHSALSAILIDLDRFKSINDAFGHQAGDMLLKQFADLLQDTASSADIIARFGGDEFLLAIREPIGIAYNLAELIRTQTAAKEFRIDNQRIPLTLSIGIAERVAGASAEDLLREADRCVYAAKSEGRNKIVTDSDLTASAEASGEDLILADLENRIRVVTDRLASYLLIRSRSIAHHYKREASTDGLTGLFNRGHLDRLIDRELKKAKTCCRSLSVAMVDLDDFGKINREHNWTGGDLAIKTAASVIQGQIRANDWVARYGGDEMFVVMPDTQRAAAERIAERIRKALEETPISLARETLQVTASIGVTEYDPETMDLQALYGAAGQAARQAKIAGKNRVVTG